MSTFLAIMLSVLAVSAAVMIVLFVLVPFFKGLAWFIKHVFAFVSGMLYALLRAVGAVVTSAVLIPLILVNVVIGRWSAASHFGRSLQDEGRMIGQCVYRFFIGHPARLLLLTPLVEGLERRVPEAVAHAPGADKPPKRAGQFEGYAIVGSLRSGGSGSRLYIADPDEKKREMFRRRGVDAGQVVIKTFSLADGSSLPQIVRESKSLEAAKRLGLILEHELTDKRFFYVMPYVPGDTLSAATNQLHDRSGPEGLNGPALAEAMSYTADLVHTLDMYHRGGLWHKDVKPDNIIISDGRAHLVDFGLVTPLRSAMTLTTHGTEYFRDPEMVRMALKGVKVHEVDGARFDVYAAGAVLYSIIERSFPAHGGLSQITRRCPEALRWIVRRAMAEYDRRYATAKEMFDDLAFVQAAADPFAVRPGDLPSVRGGGAVSAEDFASPAPEPMPGPLPRPAPSPFGAQAGAPGVAGGAAAAAAAAGSPIPPRGLMEQIGRKVDEAVAAAVASRDRAGATLAGSPQIRVTNWWSGSFARGGGPFARATPAGFGAAGAPAPTPTPARGGPRVPAAEQLRRARERVAARQARATGRLSRGGRPARYDAGPNAGVLVAAMVLFALCAALVYAVVAASRGDRRNVVWEWSGAEAPEFTTVGEDVRAALAEGFEKDFAGMGDQIRAGVQGGFAGMAETFKQAGERMREQGELLQELREDLREAVKDEADAAAQARELGLRAARAGQQGRGEEASEYAAEAGQAAQEAQEAAARAATIREAINGALRELGAAGAVMRGAAGPVPALPAPPAPAPVPAPEAAPAPVAPPAPAARAARTDRGTWLVLDDLTGAPPAVRARVELAVGTLLAYGATVVGLSETDEDVSLAAAARKAIGPVARINDETAGLVRGWLREGPEGVDGVVWLARTDDPDRFATVVVGRSSADAERVGRLLEPRR